MTHYDVLGVSPSADLATLRQAYVALARRHHPDRVGGDASTMRALNDAWATLGDPARRAAYDRSLFSAPTTPPHPPSPAAAPRPWEWEDDWDLEDEASWSAGRDDIARTADGALPLWPRLVPAATLVLAAATLLGGAVLRSEPVIAASLMLGALATVFFISAPFIALLVARRRRSLPQDQ